MTSKNVVIIGDGYVGKTSIVTAIKGEEFHEQIPSVYDDFNYETSTNGKRYNLKFIDTAGQEEYAMLRKLSYKEADVFLLCFAVDDIVSFENMETTWIPELEEYGNVPIVLIGTKADLRRSGKCISKEQIVRFYKKINALFYMECSAKTREGIDDLKRKLLRLEVKERTCCLQ